MLLTLNQLWLLGTISCHRWPLTPSESQIEKLTILLMLNQLWLLGMISCHNSDPQWKRLYMSSPSADRQLQTVLPPARADLSPSSGPWYLFPLWHHSGMISTPWQWDGRQLKDRFLTVRPGQTVGGWRSRAGGWMRSAVLMLDHLWLCCSPTAGPSRRSACPSWREPDVQTPSCRWHDTASHVSSYWWPLVTFNPHLHTGDVRHKLIDTTSGSDATSDPDALDDP